MYARLAERSWHLVLIFFVMFCTSCATFLGGATGQYRSYVESRVQTKRLFDDGKQTLMVKLLATDEELRIKQEELTPGFSFERKNDSRQFVMSIAFSSFESFLLDDFKITLNGQRPHDLSEIRGAQLRKLYPFAYPHSRVFLINFEKLPNQSVPSTSLLKIRSPVGALNFEVST